MATALQPWQILVATFAGWISRHQYAVIDYLREENRVLKQQLGRRRLRLTDDRRRRLAVRGKAIGRRALQGALYNVGHRVGRATIADTLIESDVPTESAIRGVACRERLGGMLRYYFRPAA
jgi:hypothetical protein